MKKTINIFAIIISMLLFGSCGVNTAIILNHNQNNTQVSLSSNNFKVVDKVSGSAEVKYIFMIGGLYH